MYGQDISILDLLGLSLWTLATIGTSVWAVWKFFGNVIADRALEHLKVQLEIHLENHKASLSRDAQRLSSNLRNSEFFFARRFDAAKELFSLKTNLLPRQRYEEYEAYDAYVDLAPSFRKIFKKVEVFEYEYGPALPEGVHKKIRECIEAAQAGSLLKQTWIDTEMSKLTKEAEDYAEKIMSSLERAYVELLVALRSASDEQSEEDEDLNK